MKKLPVSVALISLNEADNIGGTLNAVKDWADEIIVVDSGSKDDTVNIARGFGARVFTEDWKGFADQKNSALEKCNNDWMLFLDCDEIPDDVLIQSIKQVIERGNLGAYFVNRRTNYFGKILTRSWQPDRVLRLVHKNVKPVFTGGKVHEKLETKSTNGALDGYLIHYSYKDLNDHLQKTIKYARLGAEKYYNSGKKFTIRNLILNPAFAFVKMYFVSLGFTEGVRGFLAAVSSFLGTFLKYAFLWELGFFDKRKK